MALYLDLQVGESVDLDDGRMRLTLEEKRGQRAKLKVEAPDSVTISRPQTPTLTKPPTQNSTGSQE